MIRPPVLLAAAIAVAGCLGGGGGPADAPAGDRDGRAPAFALDCALARTGWNESCNALASPNESPSKTEVDLAVNPKDPTNVFVASKDLDPIASDCVWSVGQVTKDAGQTWTTVYVGGTLADRAPGHPLAGWRCVTDPIMAFDSQGVLYYPLQAYEVRPKSLPGEPTGLLTVGSAFFLAVSRDGGETFPDVVPMALAEGTIVFHDYPRMAVSPTTDSVATIWNAISLVEGNAYVATTRDGGRSVGPPAVIAHPEAPRSTFFASGFAAAADGTFYATVTLGRPLDAFAGRDGPVEPVIAVSTDDAATFPTFRATGIAAMPIPSPLPNVEFRTGTSFELAIDRSGGPRDGQLYVTWEDYATGNSEILVARSADGGATWSEPVNVTRDPNDQFMARPVVAADGSVHVLMMDRRYDPANTLLDATHAWSLDGGDTWSFERLTTTSFDGDLGIHQDGFPFIGDYVGISTVGDHLWFGFPTTQSGRAEIAVAHAVKR